MAFKPRIILTGDASAGARWIGVAKRLANLVVPKGSTRRQIVVGDATIQTEKLSKMRQRIGMPNALHQKPSALADGCLREYTKDAP